MGFANCYAVPASALSNLVRCVVAMSSKPKVRRVHTGGRVAAVADAKARRDWAAQKHPSNSVGLLAPTVVGQMPVAEPIDGRGP